MRHILVFIAFFAITFFALHVTGIEIEDELERRKKRGKGRKTKSRDRQL